MFNVPSIALFSSRHATFIEILATPFSGAGGGAMFMWYFLCFPVSMAKFPVATQLMLSVWRPFNRVSSESLYTFLAAHTCFCLLFIFIYFMSVDLMLLV